MNKSNLVNGLSAALIAIVATGCIAGGDETDELIADNYTSFEDWKSSLLTDPYDGAYIVEGDIRVHDEEQLEMYYAQSQLGALTVNTVNGKDDRWSASSAMNLTYCVSTTFGPNHATVVNAMNAAGNAWAAVAAVRFVYVSAQDGSCNASNTNVVFNVSPVSGSSYNAAAFFPSDSRAWRELLIDWNNVAIAAPKTLTGIMKHELGHTLGFRHEHIRSGKPGCPTEDKEWRALTAYDSASVMHYPPYAAWYCKGTNQGDYQLTQLDKDGVASLYGVEHRLIAKHSGKCVDVNGGDTANGATLIQWSCTGGDNQDFVLAKGSDGYYNLIAEHSGKCVDVSGADTADGADLVQWSCGGNSADNQKFSLVSVGDGYYNLVAKHSGKCVDVEGLNTADGASLVQWSCNGGDNQKFTVEGL